MLFRPTLSCLSRGNSLPQVGMTGLVGCKITQIFSIHLAECKKSLKARETFSPFHFFTFSLFQLHTPCSQVYSTLYKKVKNQDISEWAF